MWTCNPFAELTGTKLLGKTPPTYFNTTFTLSTSGSSLNPKENISGLDVVGAIASALQLLSTRKRSLNEAVST